MLFGNLEGWRLSTIGGLSSKFDEFLAARSQLDNDHGVDLGR